VGSERAMSAQVVVGTGDYGRGYGMGFEGGVGMCIV
jgi:hypothetical protein